MVPSENLTFERAAWWLDLGVELVPVQPGTKQLIPGYGPHRRRIAKVRDAEVWFRHRGCGLGVLCGSGFGLVVADFDKPDPFARWLADNADLPTLVETSATRGCGHVFIFDPEAVNDLGHGFELRARNRVVVVAPSVVGETAYGVLRAAAPVRAVAAELFPLLSKPSRVVAAPMAPAPVRVSSPLSGSLVERIKAERPILGVAYDLFRQRGLELRCSDGGRGRWYAGRCPFHDDHRPSFWVDAERGLFGCHVARCVAHRGGDVINLLALGSGVNLGAAIADLARGLR